MNRRKMIELFVAMLIPFQGCGTRKISRSEVMHEDGRYARTAFPFFWDETSYDEVLNIVLPAAGIEDDLLPADHVLNQRLNAWLEKMDAMARVIDPALNEWSVPSPRAFLLNSGFVNAFSASIPLCLSLEGQDSPVTIEIPPGVGSEPLQARVHSAVFGSDGRVVVTRGRECKSKTLTQEEFKALLDFQFGNEKESAETCRYEANGANVRVSPECLDESIKGSGKIPLRYYVTSNAMVVMKGVFARLEDESQLVALLAHELGHFYRSHMTRPDLDLGMFYRVIETRTNGAPKRHPELEAFGKRLLDLHKEQQWFAGSFFPLEGQILPSFSLEYFRNTTWKSVLDAKCSEGECRRACEEASAAAHDPSLEGMLRFPGQSALRGFKIFEKKASSCLRKVTGTPAELLSTRLNQTVAWVFSDEFLESHGYRATREERTLENLLVSIQDDIRASMNECAKLNARAASVRWILDGTERCLQDRGR